MPLCFKNAKRHCRLYSLGNNSLSGTVPTAQTRFGAASFDVNCLSNYTSQPWCPQLLSLTDLYVATNGSGWTRSTNWLAGDPCNAWFGVTCNASRVIVYVETVLLSHEVNAIVRLLRVPACVEPLLRKDCLYLRVQHHPRHRIVRCAHNSVFSKRCFTAAALSAVCPISPFPFIACL
jgi:hypothetical protein